MRRARRFIRSAVLLIAVAVSSPTFPIAAQCLPPQGCRLVGYFPCSDYYSNCGNGCPADECEYNCSGRIKIIDGQCCECT